MYNINTLYFVSSLESKVYYDLSEFKKYFTAYYIFTWMSNDLNSDFYENTHS